MERAGEEAQTEESPRGSARPTGRPGAQRGQTERQPRKRPQGWSGQKPQKDNCRPPQRAASAPWPQEIIEIVIASIRACFGDGIIGLGDCGIRFAGAGGEGVSHAHTA
jgi:hypothetical protein